MAFRIDDEENRYQDLKDKVDQLEIQTFSPEVVARNESTRNTGIETGSGAATNPYPLWPPIRDFGTVGSVTLDIVLNRTDGHVAKLTANGDIIFAFSLPPGTNKSMSFILDVTIDNVGGYALTFGNTILPAGISIDNTANARTVLRFGTTDGGVTYYAENISVTGGGISFPIDFPEEPDRGTVTTTQVIDFATSTRHSISMTIGAASVAIDFSNEPANKVAISSITVKQDGTGGRAITFVDTVVNSSVIIDAFAALAINESITFIIEWERAVFTAYLKTGNIGGGGTTLPVADTTAIVKGSVDTTKLFRLDVGNNTTGITGVLATKFTTAKTVTLPDISGELLSLAGTQTVLGIKTFSANIIAGGAGNGVSNLGNIKFVNNSATPTGIAIYSDGTNILFTANIKFPSSVIDIGDDTNPLNDIFVKRVRLQTGSIVTNKPTITSTTGNNVVINFPTGSSLNIFEQGVVKHTFSPSSLTTPNIILSGTLTINDSTTDPSTNGQFSRNGNDLKLFTGGKLVNLSTLANTSLSNLGTTAINADLLFDAVGKNIGATLIPLNNLFVEQVRFITGAIVINKPMITTTTGNSVDLNFPTGSALNIYEQGVVKHIFSPSSLTTPNIILTNTLTISDSVLDPLSNGQFTRNGVDVKVFTNGVVKNLSDIGAGSPLTTKGDLFTFSTVDARLPVGTNGQVLSADSAETTGLKWIAAGGANTALSNLASVAINTALLPTGDNTLDIGSSANTWKDMYAQKYRIETGGNSVININQITADAGGTNLNVPDGDAFTILVNGADNIFFEEDEIRFQTGRAHKITATTLSLDIIAENLTDSVKIITGTGRSNENIKIEDFKTTWFTDNTETAAMLLQLVQNNNTPANFRTIANIDMIAENSVSADKIYARISASSNDITSAAEDGLLQLGVLSAGTLISAMDMEGGTSATDGAKISFYGQTTVTRQTLSASPTNTEISTVLRNLGLTKL